jgi:hypothetical protein
VDENPTYSISGGGSFEFGDVDDSFVLSATANGFPLGDSNYTIETWINPDNLSQLTALVVYGTLGENSANAIGLSNSSIFVDWVDNNLSSPTQSMIAGNWYYLSSTYDGTDRKIYLNGSLIASDTPGVTHSITTGDTFTIGNFMGLPFTGKISIVKLHTKALSSSRLLSNFNSLKNRFGYTFGSMTFNDTQSAYLISNSSDYAFGTNDFTVEAFFKSATSSDSFAGIVSLRNNDTYNNGVNINLQSANTSTPLIEFSAGDNYLTYTASNDEWYHVAISRTGGTSSLFVNGELFNEVADTLSYGNNDLVVGRYHTTVNDYYFNGLISNVRVINGTGLYTGTFSIPSVQLSGTYSDTKFLITSQEVNPTKDMTGLHSVTASNIGWTSSLPVFIPPYDIYFDASNISSYSGTGTTLNNIGASGSIPGLIGTMTNVSYNSGIAGGVLDFNSSASISFDQYDFGDTITLNAWVYPRNRFSINTLMSNASAGLSSNGFKLEWNTWETTDLRMIIENGNGSAGNGRATDNPVITENSWQMLTYVIDFVNQTGKLYLNGVEQSSNGMIVPNISRNNTWYIGSMFGAYQMDAYLGEFKVWKSIQSDSSITSEFNSSKSRYGL